MRINCVANKQLMRGGQSGARTMIEPVELRISNGRMAFGDVPEHVDLKLQAAVAARATPETCEALLWEAHKLGPRVLPVFYALYKFYFNRKQLANAERAALIGLDAAAHEMGVSSDWRTLTPQSAADWAVEGATRFYLFTMKALAFINLRRDRADVANELLAKLAELDPADHVGYGVIALLAKGGAEE
jgi:hypothetical protein